MFHSGPWVNWWVSLEVGGEALGPETSSALWAWSTWGSLNSAEETVGKVTGTSFLLSNGLMAGELALSFWLSPLYWEPTTESRGPQARRSGCVDWETWLFSKCWP